jgi:ABC-type Zn uptake system ZnuABC Zn-binding protein ZnuA
VLRALLLPITAVCVVTLGVAIALGGGTSTPGDGAAARQTGVVATTTEVADIVRHVAGERARVTGILAPNADPHEYELRPGDVGAVADADVVVRSGGDVDAWLDDAVEAHAGATVVDLGRAVRLHGDDPHWWQDPRNGALAAEAVGAALAEADPAHAAGYRSAARAYAQRLRRLDGQIAACWSHVQPAQRRLVTTHDAYGYYARRYGVTVVGAVIPSLSTRAQPSPRALGRLVRAIRRQRIRAVFTERALNPRVERAVAREAGATVGRPLSGDTLGRRGSPSGTYTGALASDTRALVDGLAGRDVGCDLGAATP